MKTNNEILIVNWIGEFIKMKPSKVYKDFGIAITKLKDNVYTLTDIESGLGCGKHFIKFSDAKSFMEHTDKANFINWFNAISIVRLTSSYTGLVKDRLNSEFGRKAINNE